MAVPDFIKRQAGMPVPPLRGLKGRGNLCFQTTIATNVENKDAGSRFSSGWELLKFGFCYFEFV
jgi:hypothetical protein